MLYIPWKRQYVWGVIFSHSVNLKANPYQNLNSIFQLEFFQDWELAQNQLDTIGFSWTFFQLILHLIGLDWTFSQLDICWEIKFPIGNILRGDIYHWKKQNPTNSNSLKSNQLSPTEFSIGLSWPQVLFQLENQYSQNKPSHANSIPAQSNSFQLVFQLDWVGNFGKRTLRFHALLIMTILSLQSSVRL